MNSLRPRVIPCLQFSGGELLKTRRFRDPQYLGDPINAVKLFNDLECDELVVVDIRATLERREPDYAMIEEFAAEAFMPLTYGGGITSVEQIRCILSIGIEKVVIGAAAPDGALIAAAAAVFGSQSIVVAIDVKKTLLGRREVCTRSGTHTLAGAARLRRGDAAGRGRRAVRAIHRPGRCARRLRPGVDAGRERGGSDSGDRLRRRRQSGRYPRSTALEQRRRRGGWHYVRAAR
jgi:cyclase